MRNKDKERNGENLLKMGEVLSTCKQERVEFNELIL